MASKYTGKTFVATKRISPIESVKVWEIGTELKRNVELKEWTDERIDINLELNQIKEKGAENG